MPSDAPDGCPTPSPGIICGGCGGSHLRVYRTKTAAAIGLVIRYRQCVACGEAVRTRERVEAVVRPGRKVGTNDPDPAELPGV